MIMWYIYGLHSLLCIYVGYKSRNLYHFCVSYAFHLVPSLTRVAIVKFSFCLS